jgi:cytochrome c-type biogenesis protein CcmE
LKARAKFAVGSLIILATIGWLGWVGVTQSKTYYHTIAELSTLKGAELRQRMRVSGNVQAGSVQRLPGRVDFVLVEEGRTLPVSYVGSDPLPDTFKDGAQALVEGKSMPDGRFVAEQVQAKCASKYEAAPTQPSNAAAPEKKS